MISLTKTDKPRVLEDNADRWHAELLAIIARGEKPTETLKSRYRHEQIKTALVIETSGKCAYCESKIRHIAHGDIEHIVPKSKVPSKAYDWENLTLACDICNENKGNFYCDDPSRTHENLIDPYADKPSDHFMFVREIVLARPDSLRGAETDDVIKISRSELLERRRERMDFLDGLVRAYNLAEDRYKPLLLRNLHKKHLGRDNEYSAVANAYIIYLENIGSIQRYAES